MDEITFPAVLTDLMADLQTLLSWHGTSPDLDLGTAETAQELAVLGDSAARIWNLGDDHSRRTIDIVDRV